MSFSVDALASPPMHDAYQIIPFRKEEKQEEREERECDAQTRLHQPEKNPSSSRVRWPIAAVVSALDDVHFFAEEEGGAHQDNCGKRCNREIFFDFMASVWQRWTDDKTKRKPPVPTDNQIDEVPGKSILLALLQAPPSRQEKTKHTVVVFFFSKRERTQTVE